MSKGRFQMQRKALSDGRYCFYLVDSHKIQADLSYRIYASEAGRSPIAPHRLRVLQAKLNSRHVLDSLNIY